MRIGIDIDGVLADFVSAFRELVHQHTEVRMPPPSDTWPDVWDFHYAAGVTKEQSNILWNDHIKPGPFLAALHAYPGAVEALMFLDQLSREGNDIYFVTSRAGDMAKFYTEQWLNWHGYSRPTVIIAPDNSKGDLAAALKLEVFIDDKPENCVDVKNAKPSCRTYLIDKPYNRGELKSSNGFPLANGSRVLSAMNILEVLKREFGYGEAKAA